MIYQLIISPEAELDIQDGFEWYEQRSSGLGSEFVRAVDSSLAINRTQPFSLSSSISTSTTSFNTSISLWSNVYFVRKYNYYYRLFSRQTRP